MLESFKHLLVGDIPDMTGACFLNSPGDLIITCIIDGRAELLKKAGDQFPLLRKRQTPRLMAYFLDVHVPRLVFSRVTSRLSLREITNHTWRSGGMNCLWASQSGLRLVDESLLSQTLGSALRSSEQFGRQEVGELLDGIRLVAVGDEQGVACLDDDEVVHT